MHGVWHRVYARAWGFFVKPNKILGLFYSFFFNSVFFGYKMGSYIPVAASPTWSLFLQIRD